jgi:hypothetical protein
MNQLLDQKNPHERDQFITFDEGPHIYTILCDASSQYTSVTTWNHSHFSHFDADAVLNKLYMNQMNWNKKYEGMTKDDVKAAWEANRVDAALAGTALHYDIECYYNGLPNVNDSIEYAYFKRFAEDYKHLKPYRTEWMVWHEDVKIAGSIDMVFENDDGTLTIYDWKRSKDIVKYSQWNKYATTECIGHLPDTNYWHYCLQLNIYKRILEDKYGKTVCGLYLVCLHPNNSNQSYKLIKVVDLQPEIEDLFELRMLEVI